MLYTIIRQKAQTITQETIVSGDAHSVKSQAGKEFNADKDLEFIAVLEVKFSILILQKNPATGKMLHRFSA